MFFSGDIWMLVAIAFAGGGRFSSIAVHLSRETREQDQDSCLETAAKRSAETQPTRGRRQPTTVGPLVPNRKATREKREMIGVFGVSSLS